MSRKSLHKKIAEFYLTKSYTTRQIEKTLRRVEGKYVEVVACDFYGIYVYEGNLRKSRNGNYIIEDKDFPLNLTFYLTKKRAKPAFDNIKIKLISI